MSATAFATVGEFNLVACNFVEVRELVSAEERLFTTCHIVVAFNRRVDDLLLNPTFFLSCVETAFVFDFDE